MAAFDVDEGVISPGGIGFDINCIGEDTRILLRHGCYKKIKDFEADFSEDLISFMNLKTNKKAEAKALMFMKKKADCKVLRIATECGEELVLTEDHPVYNGQGMVRAGELNEGDSVIIHPFEGVEYEKASGEIIVDEKDVIALVGNRYKLIRTLKEKGLLPLRANSEKLPLLAKLLGYLTGDGWLGKNYIKRRKQEVWSMVATGKVEDLKEISQDIQLLGYENNYRTTRYAESEIEGTDGKKRIIRGNTSQLRINSQSLAVLMKALGLPEGNKSRTITYVPLWIKKSPLWIKRLYLAGLFGAELTIPYQRKGEHRSFTEPSFSQNKILNLEKENEQFIMEIVDLLSEFGVRVNKIYRQKGIINSYREKTGKVALRISAKPANLVRLWARIGFEYCRERKEKSIIAIAYLKKKMRVLQMRGKFLERSKNLVSHGAGLKLICRAADRFGISESTVKSYLYRDIKNIRITSEFPTFEEFTSTHQISDSEFIKDNITGIEEIDYDKYVYDFTMNDSNHNFIANSIVSSNCGMRLAVTNLTLDEVKPKLKELVDTFFKTVPAGVGSKGFVKLSNSEFEDIMVEGAQWCIKNGYGWENDKKRMEEYGKIKGADPSKVSQRARQRGINQLGTLGSGNHYLEVQFSQAGQIYDEKIASAFGITQPNQIVIMVHCGSRGFGHQVATDYLKVFDESLKKYNITVRDRQLACAPFSSREGQDYYAAMACAANAAFANRQVILHRIREGFSKVFGQEPEKLGLNLVYDVAHNIAKVEEYKIEGKMKKVLVHRKGSTRSFGPGNSELDEAYRKFGQPVILGGSMETGSYLLVGTKQAEEETFGSTAHGSGRTMSRTAAKHQVRGEKLQRDMESKGIYVKAVSMSGLAEEAGFAYKDINEVVNAIDGAGISKKIVALKPIANVKG